MVACTSVALAAWMLWFVGKAPSSTGSATSHGASTAFTRQDAAPAQVIEPSPAKMPATIIREAVPELAPRAVIDSYPRTDLPGRVAALRYLDSSESWSEADRAALLDAMLRDPVPEMRMAALVQVEAEYFRAAFPMLERAARDASAYVRTAAIEALAASGDSRVVAPLQQALFDVEPALRTLTLDASAQLEVKLRRPVLLRAMESPDDAVVGTAVSALWDVLSPEVIPPVMRLLDSPSEPRKSAAQGFLQALFGEYFTSRRDAELWWSQNRHQHEAALVP